MIKGFCYFCYIFIQSSLNCTKNYFLYKYNVFIIHFILQASQMLDLAFDISADKEKRETAMNNLLVLARDRAGAEEIFKQNGVSKIIKLMKIEKNEEIICSAIRIIGELCKNSISRTESIIRDIGVPWFLEMIDSKYTERVNASQYCLQVINQTYIIIIDRDENVLTYEFIKT